MVIVAMGITYGHIEKLSITQSRRVVQMFAEEFKPWRPIIDRLAGNETSFAG